METTDHDRQTEFLSRFLRHQEDLRAVIASMVRDWNAVDDIFQETAIVLWKKFDQYDPSRSFGGWARGIAVYKVLQAFEKNKRLPIAFSPDVIEAVFATAVADDEPASEEQQRALAACLAKLPERSRRLIALRYHDGLALQTIAERVASTMGAVHKALSRIRDALKRCVREEIAALEGR